MYRHLIPPIAFVVVLGVVTTLADACQNGQRGRPSGQGFAQRPFPPPGAQPYTPFPQLAQQSYLRAMAAQQAALQQAAFQQAALRQAMLQRANVQQPAEREAEDREELSARRAAAKERREKLARRREARRQVIRATSAASSD